MRKQLSADGSNGANSAYPRKQEGKTSGDKLRLLQTMSAKDYMRASIGFHFRVKGRTFLVAVQNTHYRLVPPSVIVLELDFVRSLRTLERANAEACLQKSDRITWDPSNSYFHSSGHLQEDAVLCDRRMPKPTAFERVFLRVWFKIGRRLVVSHTVANR